MKKLKNSTLLVKGLTLTALSSLAFLVGSLGMAVYGQKDQILRAEWTSENPMKIGLDDEVWSKAPIQHIQLLAQPMIQPRPKLTLTEEIRVQAVHNRKSVAFRLSWKDPDKSDDGRLGKFSDAVALQFPVRQKDKPLPPPFMGGKDQPVHIYHWRAQAQNDKEQGRFPTVKELYPNMSVDTYPLEFKDPDMPQGNEAQRRIFAAGQAAGNPRSFYQGYGLDEILAEGFGTSSVTSNRESEAEGQWKDGEWSVVIARPFKNELGSTLYTGQNNNVCFAVWQGGKNEVGSRKSLTMMWIELDMK